MNLKLSSLLVLSGLIAVSATTQAQTVTLLDTIGTVQTNSGWQFDTSNRSQSYPVGYDPNGAGGTPLSASQAGYAAAPITFNQSTTLSSLDLIINIQAPGNSADLSNDVYGAFYTPSASGAKSLSTSTQVTGYFKFDLNSIIAPAGNPVSSNNVGNGTQEIATALLPSNLSLAKGTYYLVIAPKAGLNTQDSDIATRVGFVSTRPSATISGSTIGGSISTSYASAGTGLGEINGARPGDVLTSRYTNTYFGLRLKGTTGAASVPAPSSVLTMAVGSGLFGGLVIRRRRK